MNLYEILFYDGEQMPPCYYLIDGIYGDTPEDILKEKLGEVVNRVREILCLGGDFPERKICDGLYLLKENGLVSARLNVFTS